VIHLRWKVFSSNFLTSSKSVLHYIGTAIQLEHRMKRSEIIVGNVYVVKVSGKLAPVRVTHERSTVARGTYASASINGSIYGRPRTIAKFMGINEKTGRSIGPFTAAKCRCECERLGSGVWVRKAVA